MKAKQLMKAKGVEKKIQRRPPPANKQKQLSIKGIM